MNQTLLETFNLCCCMASVFVFMISMIINEGSLSFTNLYTYYCKTYSKATLMIFGIVFILSTMIYATDPFFQTIGIISSIISMTIELKTLTDACKSINKTVIQ